MRRSSFLLCAVALTAGLMGQSVVDIHSTVVNGRPVTYQVRDGYAVAQGDILLGPVVPIGELLDQSRMLPRAAAQNFPFASPSLWPSAMMFYAIDPDVPNPSRILAAVDHWNTRTPFKIMPRTTEPNYVRFHRANPGSACSSYVGMLGGEQPIFLEDACTTGNVIHEVGHAWGLLHEQARNDRNASVTVLFDNIDPQFAGNFVQESSHHQGSRLLRLRFDHALRLSGFHQQWRRYS